MEIEVFRLMEPSARRDFPNYPENKFFSVDKCYEYALYTRRSGSWPNERHFTTHPMQYVGRYVRSSRWGYGDNRGGAEVFNNNGTEVSIALDYEGRASFREVPCREGGGVEAAVVGTAPASGTSAAAGTIFQSMPNTSAATSTIQTKPKANTEPLEKAENLNEACVVCLDNKKTDIFVPCGHLCVCGPCGENIMKKTRACPLCRSKSSSAIHVYQNKYLKYKQKYLKLKNEMK
jgi:hypothetical protein